MIKMKVLPKHSLLSHTLIQRVFDVTVTIHAYMPHLYGCWGQGKVCWVKGNPSMFPWWSLSCICLNSTCACMTIEANKEDCSGQEVLQTTLTIKPEEM